MTSAALPLDERPRFGLADGLRRGDLRSLGWKLRRHAGAHGDVGCLRRLLPGVEIERGEIERLLDELTCSPELRGALASPAAHTLAATAEDPEAELDLERRLDLRRRGRGRALLLYVTVRLLRPEAVVETGCFTGWDTAIVLQALERNGRGRLCTIDLPAHVGSFSQLGARGGLPPGLKPGFLVPETLRERWSLRLGDVRHELCPLLEELGSVDVFFHDSHHSYSNMVWEYATVWPRLRPGGILVSDDVSWNTAIRDFARGVGRRVVIHRSNPNVGAIRC